MPDAEVYLCSVHAERTLKESAKGETCKDDLIAAFKGMIYSETEEEFQQYYSTLKKVGSQNLVDYFDDNWLRIKEVWSLKYRILVLTLRNHTTNRVESHNQKLKIVSAHPLYI